MKLFACLFFLILSSFPLWASSESIEPLVEKTMAEYQVPGAVVAIVDQGKIVHLQGYGFRDVKSKAPVDADTLFQLASVSKTFTAVTYAMAVDAEAIGWEQPVREVFEDFSLHDRYAAKWTNGIDLLVHRTGLPGFIGAIFEEVGFNREQILERIPLIKPATSFRETPAYSNLGYFLAGETAATALKTSWADLVESRIFQPLKMSRSGIASELMQSDANAAIPYVLTKDKEVQETARDTQPILLPAGGLASTGRDLANYLQMLLADGEFEGKRIVSSQAMEVLFQPIIAEEPSFAEMAPIGPNTGFSYSPGWGVFHYNGQRVLEKGGALAGYRTLIMLLPDEQYGVAILCNLNFTSFPEAIRAALLEQKLGPQPGRDFAAEIRKQWEQLQSLIAPPSPPENPVPFDLPLSAFTGVYNSLLLGNWILEEVDGELKVKAGPARFAGTLSHFDGNDFLCRWIPVNAGIHPLNFTVENGEVTGFVFDQDFRFFREP